MHYNCARPSPMSKAIRYVLLSTSWCESLKGDVGANKHQLIHSSLLPKWLVTVSVLGLSMQKSLYPTFWNDKKSKDLKKAEKTGCPGVAMWPGQNSEERPAAALGLLPNPRTTSLQSLQTPAHLTPTALLPAGPLRPKGPFRPWRALLPLYTLSDSAWMLNYYVRLFLLYYYYSCYVFYYIVWLSLTLFGNVVNKEEILLLTTFAINWKSLTLIIVQTSFIDQFYMFQNHHVLPVRTSWECILLFRCFPFHFIIPQPWFHFCDLHVFGIQLYQT